MLTRATRQHPPHGQHRFALALVCALSAYATSTTAAAAAAELKPFEASYSWMWHGLTVAISTLRLEHHGDTWTYGSKSEPRGIGRMMSERPTQQSVLQVTDSGVRPLSYKADDGTSSTKRDADVRFDWEHGQMSGVYEDKKVDGPLPPDVQDDLSVQVAMMVELLRGHTPEKFALLSGNSVREYRYSRDGVETLTTPAGTMKTIVYQSQKEGSPRITRFWCAPSLGYIPLRVEQRRDHQLEWTMQIHSLKRE